MDVINLLWDDGIVVLKDEPLNVMGPETLFFHRLGLDPQVCVIMEVGEGAANVKKKINKILKKATVNRHLAGLRLTAITVQTRASHSKLDKVKQCKKGS